VRGVAPAADLWGPRADSLGGGAELDRLGGAAGVGLDMLRAYSQGPPSPAAYRGTLQHANSMQAFYDRGTGPTRPQVGVEYYIVGDYGGVCAAAHKRALLRAGL
jgi:hypothetical protein